MTEFARITWPSTAWIQVDAPQPARYLARMSSATLNFGMPASRRGGRLLGVLGRRELPSEPIAAAVRRLPARPDPELCDIASEVRSAWPRLAAASDRLPTRAPDLSLLALQRQAGRFVLVFGADETPLIVLKPPVLSGVLDAEIAALETIRDLGVAPRVLPSLRHFTVQEGMPGRAPWVVPPGAPGWSGVYLSAFDGLGADLVRVARATATPGRPSGVCHLRSALAACGASSVPRLAAVRRDLRDLETVTLEHHDLSAQNWLVHQGRVSGIIDWEGAVWTGLPGYDAIHAAVSLLEHGVALRSWSQGRVVEEFARAWRSEPLFDRARHWHRECVRAATGGEDLADQLLIAYFGSRLGRRVWGGGPRLLSVETVSAMLDVVLGLRRAGAV